MSNINELIQEILGIHHHFGLVTGNPNMIMYTDAVGKSKPDYYNYFKETQSQIQWWLLVEDNNPIGVFGYSRQELKGNYHMVILFLEKVLYAAVEKYQRELQLKMIHELHPKNKTVYKCHFGIMPPIANNRILSKELLNGLKAYDLTYDPNDNTLINQKYVEANKIARMF